MICHGTSTRQVQAIAEGIEERLRSGDAVAPKHIEGRASGEWILLDYLDFVVHVFLDEKRKYYGLERLWGDAPSLELPVERAAAAPASPRRRRPTVSS